MEGRVLNLKKSRFTPQPPLSGVLKCTTVLRENHRVVSKSWVVSDETSENRWDGRPSRNEVPETGVKRAIVVTTIDEGGVECKLVSGNPGWETEVRESPVPEFLTPIPRPEVQGPLSQQTNRV